jgi:nucleotide-binding universal stress UspA family protein
MRILIAYDGSPSADAAIEEMPRAGLPPVAEAHVLCVEADGLPHSEGEAETESPGSWRAKLADAEHLAAEASGRIRSYFPQWAISFEGLWGSPTKTILETSRWWHPDLIVAGSFGRSRMARLFLGSVSLDLIHNAPCSVRITRTGRTSRIAGPIRILIGADGSAEAEDMIREVAARSWPENAEAQIISVVETLVPAIGGLGASTFAQEPASRIIREVDERERAWLRNVADDSANMLRQAGLTVTSTVIDGDPREVILAKAKLWNADAIFVGARGRGRMQRLLLGSVSTYILTHAHCTVEVVRGSATRRGSKVA